MNYIWIKLGVGIQVGTLFCLLSSCEKSKHEARNEEAVNKSRKEGVVKSTKKAPSLIDLQSAVLDETASESEHAERVQRIANSLKSMPVKELVSLVEGLIPPKNQKEAGLLFEAIHTLAERDPSEALPLAAQMQPGYFGAAFFDEIVKKDVDAMANWIATDCKDNKSNPSFALRTIWALARNEPALALKMLQNDNVAVSQRAIDAILSQVAKSDYPAALNAAKMVPSGQLVNALSAVVNGLAAESPSEAYEEINKLGNTQVALNSYPNLFMSWFDSDPSAASKALAEIPSEAIQTVLSGNSGQLSKLIANNQELAITVLNNVVFTDANSSIFMNAVSEIAKKTPEDALRWVQSFPDSLKKGELIREIALTRAAVNPELTVPEILKESGSYRPQFIDGAAISWGRVDPEKALNYTNSVASSDQSSYASSVLRAAIDSNLNMAIECIDENKLPESVRSSPEYAETVKTAASKLASGNLQEALKWSEGLALSEQEAAVSGIASQWAARDPVAVGNWIQNLPAGKVRNSAVRSLVGQIRNTDPEAAAQWMRTLNGQ